MDVLVADHAVWHSLELAVLRIWPLVLIASAVAAALITAGRTVKRPIKAAERELRRLTGIVENNATDIADISDDIAAIREHLDEHAEQLIDVRTTAAETAGRLAQQQHRGGFRIFK